MLLHWTLNRLDLPLEAFTAFCLDTTFLISQPFQFFRKSTILHLSSSKVRCSRFLGHLLGLFFAIYFVVLKNFKIDFFNWYFLMPSRSAPAYFNSLQAQVNDVVLTAFEISYLAFTSLVIIVELCTLLFHEVIVLKFR